MFSQQEWLHVRGEESVFQSVGISVVSWCRIHQQRSGLIRTFSLSMLMLFLFACSARDKGVDFDWAGSDSEPSSDPFSPETGTGDSGEEESDEDRHHHHDHEVITTVVLNFWADSGDDVSASFTEISGELVVDNIGLLDATDYTLTVEILNELEDPVEDVTPEIADEGEEHQLFITGSAVNGPATLDNADAIVAHAYADEDANGMPIGLENDIATLGTGSGEFTVTLRHMPLQDGTSTKTASAAADVASDGFGAIGGDNDFQITFPLTVE